MAGYFSNHSRLHNVSSDSHSQSATQAQAQAQAQAGGGNTRSSTPASARAPSDPPRPRAMSKHFSTSVQPSSGTRTGTPPVGPDGQITVHPLRTTWVFWFRAQRAPGDKIKNYEEGIKRIGAVHSVESFWAAFTRLTPPSQLLPTTDYLLFHQGVRRPIWEDTVNIQGGKWILRLRKGLADRVWEDLVLAVVGDQFKDGEMTRKEGDGMPEVCGISISVRMHEDIISLWNRFEADQKGREAIRETIRTVLNLPASTTMEYKTNNESMQDRSSFRTPMERSNSTYSTS